MSEIFKKEEKVVECETCKALREHIEYLRGQIAKLSLERQDERAEYKRTVDALILVLKGPAIGQGHTEVSKPLEIKDLMGFLETEVPPKA